jgi:hypothetical protein
MAMEPAGVLTSNLTTLNPLSIFCLIPYLDFAFEARSRSTPRLVLLGGDEVVDSERVRLFERLYDGEIGLGGVVHVDGGAARGREELGAGRGYGEDVAGVGVRSIDCVEGEVLLGLCSVSERNNAVRA